MPTDSEIRQALNTDPIVEAEKMTGKSYKEDKGTLGLGFVFNMVHGQQKAQMLEAAGDTTFSNKLDRYLGILAIEGFQQVLEVPFDYDRFGPVQHEKALYFFHPTDGILLVCTTYDNCTSLNGGKFYYNWLPNQRLQMRKVHKGYDREKKESIYAEELGWCWTPESRECTESGGGFLYDEQDGHERTGWSGDHDCREALRFHLRQLRQNGQFISPWRERPHLWLIDFNVEYEADKKFGNVWAEKSKFYDEKNRERFLMLPEQVRSKLGPPSYQGW